MGIRSGTLDDAVNARRAEQPRKKARRRCSVIGLLSRGRRPSIPQS